MCFQGFGFPVFDSFAETATRPLHSPDGLPPIHPVLKYAIQDPTTPPEVRAVIVDLQALDPVDAALETRLFVKALRTDDLAEESLVAQRQALRRAFHDWKQTLPPLQRMMSAEKLAEVCNEWADADLAEVL